ncbi:MAG: Trk system potassium transporter TrkA [Planctomycetota bacterium]|jgi:trk system potassium uptake protein|nr:Trk system potassium transporter TrkA [Planctomycetota bacterium]MDG2144239.1 Trk system potassium transporter TrkA [Planctomycetota bacterium]
MDRETSHIVIIGSGEVGHHLAEMLSKGEHRVSVIDKDPVRIRELQESLDVQAIQGDATYAEVLTRAGVRKADLVVVATNNDQVNMLACVLARSLKAKRIILRIKDTKRVDEYRFFYKGCLGYDVLLSTEELAAEMVLRTVATNHALEVESFAGGQVQLRRLRLGSDSELLGTALMKLRLPAGVMLVAVIRNHEVSVPGGQFALEADDHVYVVGKRDSLDEFEALAGEPVKLRRKVVIMGGGSAGVSIAQRLDATPGISVRLFERDPQRARSVAEMVSSRVLVLEGDATDLDFLMEEQVGEVDVFIASTRDDEDNMIACQLAKSQGVERTVALVNKRAYSSVYNLMNIDVAVSPRLQCAQRILRFVRSESVSSIAVIADGRAEVLELEAHFRGTKKERKVKNLGLPDGAKIGAVVRSEDVFIPNGESTIEDGDQIIIFALPDDIREVETIFLEPDSHVAE